MTYVRQTPAIFISLLSSVNFRASGSAMPLTSTISAVRTVWRQSSNSSLIRCMSSKRRVDKKIKMDDEKDAFYVVKKGDIIGVYNKLSDCQDQAGSSLSHPSTSVYKGYGLPKEAEEFLASHGLRNARYTIGASALEDGLFGTLMPCPFQQPGSSNAKASDKQSQLPLKRSLERPDKEKDDSHGSTSVLNSQNKHVKLDNHIDATVMPSAGQSCILEFDGASKGNPGPAGAGAVLRSEDGTVICRLREGVGSATNNAAEYRAVILGLKHALKKGFKRIRVQGDSKLVVMQIQGLWKLKNPNMAVLCKEAMELKQQFTSFKIEHVLREFNSEADSQANLAIPLKEGEVQALWVEK